MSPTYANSRWAWPTGTRPQMCLNNDGNNLEYGPGLYVGNWTADYPDGAYINYSANPAADGGDMPYELWVR